MQHIIVNLGKGCEGSTLITSLSKRDDVVLNVLCTEEHYSNLSSLLPEETALGVGTSYSLLTPRTESFPEVLASSERAWDVFRYVLKHHDAVDIIALGSLTNLAISFMRFPDLLSHISHIYFLGGSAKSGDVTAFAERSIYEDPLAAKVIFQSGVPIYMLPLDVTKDLSMKESEELLIHLMDHPEDFDLLHCHVGIETVSTKTLGMTVCDIYGKSKEEKNVELVRGYSERSEA